jgi:hypothetical protein
VVQILVRIKFGKEANVKVRWSVKLGKQKCKVLLPYWLIESRISIAQNIIKLEVL